MKTTRKTKENNNKDKRKQQERQKKTTRKTTLTLDNVVLLENVSYDLYASQQSMGIVRRRTIEYKL
jgi:hypothetical protein